MDHLRGLGAWALMMSAAPLLQRTPDGAARTLLTTLAAHTWPLAGSVRRGLLHNLAHLMRRPPDDPAVLLAARRAYAHLWLNYYDLLCGPALSQEALCAAVSLTGAAVLARLRDQGQGAILLGGHFAGGELCLQALAAHGWPALIAAERLRPPSFFAWMRQLRSAHGHSLVASDAVLTPLARRLRQGGLIGLMFDRDLTGSGHEVVLCGVPARLPAGALRLSLRLAAPIVPLHARRLPNGQALLTIYEPLTWQAGRNENETVTNGLTALAAHFESVLAQQPDQWVLTTPLWESNVDDASPSSRHTTSPFRAA